MRVAGLVLPMALSCMVVTLWAADAALKPPRMDVADIQACMRKNLVDRGSLRDIQVEVKDRAGKTQAMKMRLFWKPTANGEARMNLRLLEPADLKGSSYLLLERAGKEEIYVYLPATGKAQRITGGDLSRPLWGTDFSYADIRQVQGLVAQGNTERLADASIGSRKVYVLSSATEGDAGGYQKVVSQVDQMSCVLLKSEFFGKGDTPRKVLEADLATLDSVDNYWFVLSYTMRDLKEGTSTKLALSDLYLLERHTEALFDPAKFWQSAE